LSGKNESAIVQKGESVKIRIWPVLCVGFGALVAVIAMSGWLALVRSKSTYAGISGLYAAEYDFQKSLAAVRSNISQSAILLRDFLLDPSLSAESARSQIHQMRASTDGQLHQLEQLIAKPQSAKLQNLRQQTSAYWSSFDPVLTAPAKERARLGYSFVTTEILPRRESALNVVSEIEQLSSEAFMQRKQEIDARNAELSYYLRRSVAITFLIAAVVAGVSIFRTYTLERTAEIQHRRVQTTEAELRRLSQQLVRAQEEERRALSRELHDQVGQVLTAMRMSLGNIELSMNDPDGRLTRELEVAKRLAGQALRSTRDLAMGLRPTMLDDLGLQAALEWYGRQHSKIYGVPVALQIEPGLDRLSDAQRTCVYRLVQESLNNSAKYARAGNVEVTVALSDGALNLKITDDGAGFNAEARNGHGLGLLGMRERLTQLGGELIIDSKPQGGTRISARFPLVQTA
jgi:signal transduction histidine kinase